MSESNSSLSELCPRVSHIEQKLPLSLRDPLYFLSLRKQVDGLQMYVADTKCIQGDPAQNQFLQINRRSTIKDKLLICGVDKVLWK